jgi:hypothetical protein
MHGAAGACVTRGADVAAGRQCRRRVAAAAALLSRAPRQRPGVVEVAPETDKWAPVIFLFNKICPGDFFI